MGLKYSDQHEWVRIDGDVAYIGISNYAQDALGDIVYVELPKVGAKLAKGGSFGSIESVKAVSDLYAPVSGVVVSVNADLEDAPELLNEDPLENWIITAQLADEKELDDLMDISEYEEFCANE